MGESHDPICSLERSLTAEWKTDERWARVEMQRLVREPLKKYR